jgi:hypothetical protein
MAEIAEFEEKEYEQPLNNELLLNPSNKLWSPGQVLERHFGFDCALLTAHPYFWSLLGYPFPLPGLILNDFSWGAIWRKIGHSRRLPTFNTNLLLQIKRPEHRIGRNSTYARLGISGQYWQFQITGHQQTALEAVYQRLRNRIAICYASPVFHKLADLYDNQKNGQLVEKSTFIQIHRMTGHNWWIYDRPGSTGIGHSTPDQIEDTPFGQLLVNLRESNNNSSDDALQNLLSMEESIVSSFYQMGDINPISLEFSRRRSIIGDYINSNIQIQYPTASQAFLTVVTFCDLTKTNWFVIS